MRTQRVAVIDSADRSRGRAQRLAALACGLAVVATLAPASTAGASEAVSEDAAPALITRTARKIDHPKGVPAGSDTELVNLWTWPRGRRGYMLSDVNGGHYRGIVGIDLDTGEEVARGSFPKDRPAWGDASTLAYFGTNRPFSVAVDDEGGRLFVAYGVAELPLNNAPWTVVDNAPPRGCMRSPSQTDASRPCWAGVHVVDAASLAVVGSMPIEFFSVDGNAVSPMGRAMSYAPSRGPEDAGKVLVVVEETAHLVGSAAGEVEPRYRGGNIVYVVQLDPATGRQDWVARVDGCRGTQHFTKPALWASWGARPFPAAVFRSPSLADPAVWVGCHGSNQTGTVVRIPLDERGFPAALPVRAGDPQALAGKAVDGGPGTRPAAADVVAVAPAALVFPGPNPVPDMIADPVSERIVMRVVTQATNDEVWWVFDGKARAYIGTIGIAHSGYGGGSAGLDSATSRLYVSHGSTAPHPRKGLFVADIRRTPVPQAQHFPEFWDLPSTTDAIAVLPATETSPRLVFLRKAKGYVVVEDRLPVTVDTVLETEFVGRTVDVAEAEGVTSASLDGAARGYGARVILIGGAEGANRAGPVDVVGSARSAQKQFTAISPDPCSSEDREVVLGSVGPDGPTVVDGSGARGSAQPVVLDQRTLADMDAVVSRCSQRDWDQAWTGVLFGRPPVGEPAAPQLLGEGMAQCVSAGETSTDAMGDAVAGAFAAGVSCAEGEASGFSYARGTRVGDVSVGEAISSFRIYRDPGRGVVSRVEAVARGVAVHGVFSVDMVRGSAESWANGRRQPVDAVQREAGYRANCDTERTAGTCFQRQLFGVRSPGYSCGPCGDETALVAGLNRALGANGSARLRDPDPRLARGAGNGFLAAVQKNDAERFGDLVLNNDLLQTVVPTLEIVRFAPPTPSGTDRKGRQVVQLAGVEVSSSYGITCLLVYDEAAGTCAAATEAPGSIAIHLTDGEGVALAGGGFEVRRDVDLDGIVGLKDTLLEGGACVTAADGIGTCRFDQLAPGAYLVSQVAAPPGYSPVTDAHLVELASGEARTVTFHNATNLSTIQVSAADEAGGPLAGAGFAAYPDPDSDAKIAPDAQPAASCVTDRTGGCAMRVPAGSYVLVQTATPGGLAPIDPVAFTFASGGQTAAVGVVNYPPDSAPPAQAAPAPAYTAPPAPPPPVDTVARYRPTEIEPPPAIAGPDLTEQLGGTITRVIRAPGDALRLLARDPRQAVAWTASLTLLVLALAAIRRRHQLATLTTAPALALNGPVSPSTGPQIAAFHSGQSGTAVLERPPVAGGAHMVAEDVSVRVTIAVASDALATVITAKLTANGACELLTTVHTFQDLRAALATQTPDVLVVDLSLPTGTDDDMLDQLPVLQPPERVLGVIPADRSAQSLAARGYTIGVAGLVVAPNDLGNGQLAYAVRCVASHMPFYGPTVLALLAQHWRTRTTTPGGAPSALTARELEIARLAAGGLTRTQIAQQLVLSPGTVKTHLRTVRRKLGVTATRDAIQLRNRLGQIGLLTAPGDDHPIPPHHP